MSSAEPVGPAWMDLGHVDALLRAQLRARRRGVRLALPRPTAELRALLELVGVSGVLGVEPRREPEGGEERRVEVVLQPGDPPV
jgi:hypothetical protein